MLRLSDSLATLIQISLVFGIVSSSKLSNNFNKNDPGFYLEFAELLANYKPLNFGVGAPDFNPPKNLQKALATTAVSDNYEINQYAPSQGHPRLLKAVSNLFSKLLNQTLNPDENVVIAIGAQEALHAIFEAHTVEGDEWIVFTPYFSHFDSLIRGAGGIPRYMPLISTNTAGNITSADFKFDKEELANLFSNKTRGILVNTPHNPTGKVFDYEELSFIAELAIKWDAIVIFDEVYQFLIYSDQPHHRLATFPGMFERTITVGSAGKMLSATGYRIGWAYGPKDLINNLKVVNDVFLFAVPTPMQEAVAIFIEDEIKNYGKDNSYIETLRRECRMKRNYIYDILSDAGMTPIFSESGYFVIANWTNMVDRVNIDRKISEYADYSFIRWLVKNVNVFGYPISSFYGSGDVYREQNYIRFTIVKKWETLKKLETLLKKWKSRKGQLL